MSDYYEVQQNKSIMSRRAAKIFRLMDAAIEKHPDMKKKKDVFIGTGNSGVSVASILFAMSKRPATWGFIRKRTDVCNHGNQNELPIIDLCKANIWLIDDFVYSGDTIVDLCYSCKSCLPVGNIVGIITMSTLIKTWKIESIMRERELWRYKSLY